MADASHFQLHVTDVEPAPVEPKDGWRDMDIRFLVRDDNANSGEICFWRTLFPPGAAHERHYHPNAAEVLYVLRGRGGAGTEDEEHEVTAGSVVYIPRGAIHWLRNLDPEQELEIVGCYAPVGSLEEAGYVFVSDITDEYQQVE
jgi:quercetin dioxygenase-like cupin family protein